MKRSWSVPLFPVFGIKLEVHASFLLLLGYAAFIGYRVGGTFAAGWSVAIVVGGFTCVVLHELGHSLTARFYGIRTHRILLLPIGGVAQLSEMPRQPRRELAITVAGPAVNFALVALLSALLYLGYARMDLATFAREIDRLTFTPAGFIRTMLFYNLAMGLFNCLPVFPMDGGRILRAALAFRLSYVRATQVAVWTGRPLALCCLAAGVYLGQWLLVILFLFIFVLGELEWRLVRRRGTHWHLPVGDLTAQRFVRVGPEATLQHALQICLVEQPAEIVVCSEDKVLTIFTPDEVRSHIPTHPPDTPLASLKSAPTLLAQAHWPLAALGKHLDTENLKRIPVYHGSTLLGILRLDRLDDLLEWHRLRLNDDATQWVERQDSRITAGSATPAANTDLK